MRKLLITFSLIFALFGSSVIVNTAVQKGTVNISSTLDGDVLIDGSDSQMDMGSVMDLNATPIDDSNVFAFWIVNGFVRTDLPAVTQLRVQSKMNLVAVFRSANKHAVLFVDSNGKLIDDVYVADGETATAPSTTGLTKPGGLTVADEANRWISLEGNTSLAGINSSRVYVLQYEMPATSVEIMAIGAVEEMFTANKNDVVTVVADIANFKYWADEDGNVLSYNSTYSFTVLGATTIEAIEEGESVTAESFVKMTDLTGIRVGYESYMGRVELHGEDELVEFGFIMSTTEVGAITHESTGVIVSKSNAYNPATGEFLMSFPLVNFLSIRAYAIIHNGTELVYVYNELPGSFASDLFISEYIEGSSNNKAIEIYNGTGSPVDLSSYNLKIYVNGSDTPGSAINLSGTLNPGEVYVVANPSAHATILEKANMTSGSLSHNGNDAVGLFKGTTLVDIFGKPGDSSDYAKDTTRVRNEFVSQPSIEWKTEEWDVFSSDTFTYLGSHTMDGASVTLTDSQSILLDAMNIGEFGPIKADGTITLPLTGANGTTISWASDAEYIIDPSTKAVIIPSGAPETVTLTATISIGGLSKSVTRNVLVGLTYEERVLADKEAIDFSITSVDVDGPISLPTSGSIHGSSITWTSSNTDFITDEGMVTRPQDQDVTVRLTATFELEGASSSMTFDILVIKEGGTPPPTVEILHQSDFGETDGWGGYDLLKDKDIENGSEDPNPTGTSKWDILGGNVNGTSWNYIRMGGKAASVENPATVYMATKFSFTETVTEIIVNIVALDGATGEEILYLQTSANGSDWTTVSSKQTIVGDLTFDGLNIASNSFFRFVFERKSSGSSNKGTDIKTITFSGF